MTKEEFADRVISLIRKTGYDKGCPHLFGLKDETDTCMSKEYTCYDCWEQALKEIEGI